MKKWSKEIIRSVVAGVLLPAGLLVAVVAASNQSQTPEPTRAGVAVTLPWCTAPTVQPDSTLYIPVLREGEVENMDIEEYLVGVVLAEVSTSFAVEALKAQIVAARTYALKCHSLAYKHGGAVCTEAVCCQGYLAPQDYLDRTGDIAGVEKVRNAVQETAGLVVTYEGKLILATYFDCSGGYTEDAEIVWGKAYPYLKAVESPGEEGADHYYDEKWFTAEQFRQALGVEPEGDPQDWFGEVILSPGGGVQTMVIGAVRYQGTTLRKLLGLRSTIFSVEVDEGKICISTWGYGHRVGLSQHGADAMAENGCGFQEILLHYYPGTRLESFAFGSGME